MKPEEQKAEEFWKLVKPEIGGTLREANIPINNDTKAAAIAGAQLGVRVMSELIEQYLLDQNADPATFITMLKMHGGKKP